MSKNRAGGAEFLRSVELLSTVDAAWLADLKGQLTVVHVDEDEFVFRAGESADAVYIVRAGRIAVFTDTPRKPVRLIERLGPGGLAGLVGALGGAQRAASARASEPSTLLRLSRAELMRLLELDACLGLRFTLAAVSRHARNAAAALELGDRREARIRVDCPVDLTIGPQHAVRANVENLSLGGICFAGPPPGDFPDGPTWYTVDLTDGQQVLRFHGRVAWRRGERIGLAFTRRAPGHDLLIQGALRRLLQNAFSTSGGSTAPGEALAGVPAARQAPVPAGPRTADLFAAKEPTGRDCGALPAQAK